MKTISSHSHRQICKSLSWKPCVPQHSGPSASLGMAHHSHWGVLSVLSSINLFLPQVRPQIHFLCPYQEPRAMRKGPLDSLILTLQIYKELSRIFQFLVARKETFPVVPTSLKRKTNQLPPHSSIRASQDPPPNQAWIWRDLSVISLQVSGRDEQKRILSIWFVN